MRLAALALVTLAGCAAQPATPEGPILLDETGWTLVSLGGAPVSAAVFLGINGDRASGIAPCNRYAGAFEQAGARVSIGPIAATRMACPDLDLEQRYLGGLTDAARSEVEGDRLVLRDARGVELMAFRRDG